ncbi:hypothetical protein UCREL1_5856 [Eutypa lata UCREL1]|uniref:Uncharacterized protein n=1 Tax=Eutypa lata (strain UCR-EL1) TaxID=1287681 RepID=M7SRP3_EUTLA|nr:hypothetical protein UCREL1_5856 [Eutypa lata UCREL1]
MADGRNRTPRTARIHGLVAGELDLSQSSRVDDYTKQAVIPSVSRAVVALEKIQNTRGDSFDIHALRLAVWNEHRQLPSIDMLSTPAADSLDLFTRDEDAATRALDGLRPIYGQNRRVTLHPLFSWIVDREFTLWNIAVDGRFVTVFFRIQSVPHRGNFNFPAEGEFPVDGNGDPVDINHVYREVTDIVIIDPMDEPEDILVERFIFVRARIQAILERGSIEFPLAVEEQFIGQTTLFGQQRRPGPPAGILGTENPPILWQDIDFAFTMTIDELRESLIAGVACRARAMSNYRLFIGLLAPGTNSTYDHTVVMGPPDINRMWPDEQLTGFDNDGPPVLIDVPEDQAWPFAGLPPNPPPGGGPPGGDGGDDGGDGGDGGFLPDGPPDGGPPGGDGGDGGFPPNPPPDGGPPGGDGGDGGFPPNPPPGGGPPGGDGGDGGGDGGFLPDGPPDGGPAGSDGGSSDANSSSDDGADGPVFAGGPVVVPGPPGAGGLPAPAPVPAGPPAPVPAGPPAPVPAGPPPAGGRTRGNGPPAGGRTRGNGPPAGGRTRGNGGGAGQAPAPNPPQAGGPAGGDGGNAGGDNGAEGNAGGDDAGRGPVVRDVNLVKLPSPPTGVFRAAFSGKFPKPALKRRDTSSSTASGRVTKRSRR